MTTEIKIQIVFAVFLALELLGFYMIIIRTVANMEYAFNRMEDIVSREVQLSLRSREQHRITQEKAQSADTRGKKNELLLNIPFMERLSKDKRKE